MLLFQTRKPVSLKIAYHFKRGQRTLTDFVYKQISIHLHGMLCSKKDENEDQN